MNTKGDTKLAIIFIALFFVIAAVPLALSPSLTGFGYLSLEPEQQPIAKTIQSRGLSLITSYAVKAIPSRNEAIIIASVVASIIFLAIIGYIVHLIKQKSSPSEAIKPEAAELLEPMENSEQPVMPEHTNGQSPYDEELEKIEHELNRLH